MEERTVSLYYCYRCKGILFSYTNAVSVHGMMSMGIDEDGYEIEKGFEGNESEVHDIYCDCCGKDISEKITLPIQLFSRLRKKVYEEKKQKKLDYCIYHIELKDVENISPDEIKDIFVEALI